MICQENFFNLTDKNHCKINFRKHRSMIEEFYKIPNF